MASCSRTGPLHHQHIFPQFFLFSSSLQWAYGVALLSAATDIRSHLGEQLFDFCQLNDRLLFVTNQRIIQVKTGANKVPGRWGTVQFELPVDSIIAVFTEGDKLLVELDSSGDAVAVGSCLKFFGKKQGDTMVLLPPRPSPTFPHPLPLPLPSDTHVRPSNARPPQVLLHSHVLNHVLARRCRPLPV